MMGAIPIHSLGSLLNRGPCRTFALSIGLWDFTDPVADMVPTHDFSLYSLRFKGFD